MLDALSACDVCMCGLFAVIAVHVNTKACAMLDALSACDVCM